MWFLVRALIIVVISTVIGKERSSSGKTLGMRSLALAMLGAYSFTYLSCPNGIIQDWHVIAQIVTGISFVGAGLIIKDKSVHNLTTAILVWSMASIGILIGLDYILEAIVLSCIIFLILKYKD